jgi:hypothetical protein
MRRAVLIGLLSCCWAALPTPNARAAGTEYFTGSTSGSDWNTTATNWSSISGGPYNTAWVSGDNAILQGTSGVVAVGSVSASSMAFTTDGYANLDVNDLAVVLTNFGQTTGMTWSQGDFNYTGRVDINDLTIVLSHFGENVGAPAPGASPAPEPAGLLLAATMLVGLLAWAVGQRNRPY